jgi:hypothetical protein
VIAGTEAPLPAPRPVVQVTGTPPMVSTPMPLVFRFQVPIFPDEPTLQQKKSKKRIKTKRRTTEAVK